MEADEWAIRRRTRAIQDAEKTLALATGHESGSFVPPLTRWVASLHREAAEDLLALRKPKGLTPVEREKFEQQLRKLAAPFQERSQALAKTALHQEAS
jgi:Tfp pilus assembly protein PilP